MAIHRWGGPPVFGESGPRPAHLSRHVLHTLLATAARLDWHAYTQAEPRWVFVAVADLLRGDSSRIMGEVAAQIQVLEALQLALQPLARLTNHARTGTPGDGGRLMEAFTRCLEQAAAGSRPPAGRLLRSLAEGHIDVFDPALHRQLDLAVAFHESLPALQLLVSHAREVAVPPGGFPADADIMSSSTAVPYTASGYTEPDPSAVEIPLADYDPPAASPEPDPDASSQWF